MTNLIGQKIGHYLITGRLGEGGMAVVYIAHDDHLDREVAIKVIRREAFLIEDPAQLQARFTREARALARLTHPNIVGVIDYGEHDGAPYLVMEYLPGGSLRERMEARVKAGAPYSYAESVRIIAQIARALDFAHAQGIFHRDIKPSNILMTSSGEPMLTDFGIAKLLESQQPDTMHLTSTGTGIGTPEYMAPEQWVGKAVPLSDEYALGVVFYEMVTGRRPYAGDTPAELIIKQATQALPSPRAFAPHLSAAAESVICTALEKKPEDRFASLAAFATAIESTVTAQPEGLRPQAGQPQPEPNAPRAGEANRTRQFVEQPTIAPVNPPPFNPQQGGELLPQGFKNLGSEEAPGRQQKSASGPQESSRRQKNPALTRKAARPRLPLIAAGVVGLLVVLGIGLWQFGPGSSAQQATAVLAAAQETFTARTEEASVRAPAKPLAEQATEPPAVLPAATQPPAPWINSQNARDFTQMQRVGSSYILSARSFAFSADARIMAMSYNRKVVIYATETLKAQAEVPVDADAVALSPDGKTLATASGSTIQIWRLRGGMLLQGATLGEFSSGYKAIAFSPNQRYLAAYDATKLVIYNLEEDGKLDAMLNTIPGIRDMAFSPDSTRLAIARAATAQDPDGPVLVFGAGQWGKKMNQKASSDACGAFSVAFSPDNQRLSVGMCDRIDTWSMTNMLPIDHTIQTDNPVYDLAYSADGSVLAANSKETTNAMFLFDMASFTKINSFPGKVFLALINGGEKIALHDAGYLSLMGK